jgi:16S rRNA (cytosine967-C5)-methyltransferase
MESRALHPDAAQRQARILLELIELVEREVRAGTPADLFLARFYRRRRELGARDRRLLSAALFGWFRWRGWFGAEATRGAGLARAAAAAFAVEAADLPPAIGALAANGNWPAEAWRGLRNLPLAAKAVTAGRWFDRAPFEPRDLVPAWTPAKLFVPPGEDPEAFFLRFIEALQSRPPVWLRLRIEQRDNLLAFLACRGLAVTLHPRLPLAAQLAESVGLEPYREIRGWFEIQDLASQIVGRIAEPAAHSAWWDACAGAGGKALHLADLIQGAGKVLATDVRPQSLAECRRRAAGAGLTGIDTALWDGVADPAPNRLFDGVLLDAPCSGLGTWHRNPDARWRTPESRLDAWAAQQLALLRACAAKVRLGGTLVYATCTLTAAENTGVIETFLKIREDFEPDPFINPLTGLRCDGSLWIWPWDGPCNGMFIARLKKRKT